MTPDEVERWLRLIEIAAEKDAEANHRVMQNHQMHLDHAVTQIAAQSQIEAPERLLAMLNPPS